MKTKKISEFMAEIRILFPNDTFKVRAYFTNALVKEYNEDHEGAYESLLNAIDSEDKNA